MMAVVFGWQILVSKLYQKYPTLKVQEAATQPTTLPSGSQSFSSMGTATTNPTTMSSLSLASLTGLHAVPPIDPSPLAAVPSMVGGIGHTDPSAVMAVDTEAAGAEIKSIHLNRFYETADRKKPYEFQTAGDDGVPPAALATTAITVNGSDVDLTNARWTRTIADGISTSYALTVSDGTTPLLRLLKTYQTTTPQSPGGGYELFLGQSFTNLTGKPIKLSLTMNGPTVPPRESDRSEDRGVIAGYDDDHDVEIGHSYVQEFTKDQPEKDYVAADRRPMLWFGSDSAYFDAIIRPDNGNSVAFASAIGKALNPDAAVDDRHVGLSISTAGFVVQPSVTVPVNYRVFLGPKERSLLKSDYYSSFPMGYEKTLIYRSKYCGFLTFSWLISVLYYILFSFHFIFRDWGLAIIGLVCLVRLILHPITKKSQINMLSMGKMGPEIERLKKKYGDNKDELNKAMMQVYKEQGFTPVLGCLPMFLQMPIWIALWSALQSTFALRQAGFLRFGWLHLTWIKDLSHPDNLVHFDHPVSLIFGWTLHGINVLPIVMAGVYFIQQKMQPVPPNQTPEQEQQRKMMSWMSLLFPIFLYPAPSGLNLYILTSTTIGIFESKIIREHIKQRKEAETAGRVIVDARPTRGQRRRDGSAAKPSGKSGWLATKFAEIQAKAEQIQREAKQGKG